MSGIASKLRERRLEVGWALFSILNLAILPAFGEWETIPFHFVWVSLTLVYGPRVWRPATTIAVLIVVSVATGAELVWMALLGRGEWAEVTEVPLMAAMFLAMVWYARRYQRAVEEVRRSGDRERDFVRDASHQLRTPITVARGYAELIRQARSGTDVENDAKVILDELARLSTISDRLLLLAAAEAPGFLRPVQIDPEWLIVNTGRRWRAAAPRRWVVEAEAPGSLLADEERLESALDALIENAVRFTQEGDRIGVAIRAEGETAIMEVTDSGPGIPQEDLPRIFERFASGETRGNGAGRGTGLGLSIAHAIVAAHGGSISAASGPGTGTTVRIALPGFVRATPEAGSLRPAGIAPGKA